MNSVVVLFGALAFFLLALRLYGGSLEKAFGIDPARPTPAHEKKDGVDFVPTPWPVLFGHHFSSICGAGPIVGPALAVAYWGWGPSVLWLLLGAVFLGAVSDFSALVLSVRHGGTSVPDISGELLGRRSRLLFMAFIWLSLILVLAVFADLTARTLVAKPEIVFPSLGLIAVALLVGEMSARGAGLRTVTVVGLGLLAALLALGQKVPVSLPAAWAQPGWTTLLLAYCFVASVMPVQRLLQPRDYLASYLLFATVGMGLLGVLWTHPPMRAEAFLSFKPEAWPGAGPGWPMLFVTVACGAISGFHALVSSGTTSKQLDTEAHACGIGYGGMLMEGLVGVLVVVCVGAGLSNARHEELLRGPGAVAAFGEGYGILVRPFMGGLGAAFAVLALNTFMLTTLDTATRIGRYLTEELAQTGNKWASTGAVVAAAAALALPGHWRRIWAAFGASNQLIAALSLLIAGAWLMRQGRSALRVLLPAAFMLVTTFAAFAWQLRAALAQGDHLMTGVLGALLALVALALADALKAVGGRAAAVLNP